MINDTKNKSYNHHNSKDNRTRVFYIILVWKRNGKLSVGKLKKKLLSKASYDNRTKITLRRL